uniref:Secreted protein n=2 Tax=Caenorhabditis tropicalis TaxID=1561998 RepID=A0A1I7TQC0_9PELO
MVPKVLLLLLFFLLLLLVPFLSIAVLIMSEEEPSTNRLPPFSQASFATHLTSLLSVFCRISPFCLVDYCSQRNDLSALKTPNLRTNDTNQSEQNSENRSVRVVAHRSFM